MSREESSFSESHPGSATEPEYDDQEIWFLEAMWGEGYLSPGGPNEVRRIVEDVDFSGKQVLDFGCGCGGVSLFLAQEFPLAHITGFDVEGPVIERARRRANAKNMGDRIDFVRGQPGPLPFQEAGFDVVFSKDALSHIADKEALFREVYRVLRPGGVFAASDWLISHDGPMSVEMKEFLAAADLSFGLASPDRHEAAMRDAGFEKVSLRDRNSWYRAEAREELERLKGPLFDKVVAEVGEEMVANAIWVWTAMIKVLDSGEHRPTHLRAARPVEPA
jgi:ubiquinone/menaquinone biosynthesis C-methylase UbiE